MWKMAKKHTVARTFINVDFSVKKAFVQVYTLYFILQR